ncbi:terminase small subunit [Deinococcus navajonensis]|uniref:Terminase small subunit n=1 Tax=Deinococcus navajonensis TaxID=309884 RepID=A0ABV8XN00_9DEIO
MTQPDAPQPKTADELGAALTPQHRAFAEAYAQSGDASKAALAAGYAPSGTKNQGHRLLKREDVGAYLRALANATHGERIATLTELREFWTGTMREAEYDMRDRLKASEMLGKSFGAFIEKREHSGGLTIEVVYGDE